MRSVRPFLVLLAGQVLLAAAGVPEQQVVDRIVAHIEDDIITLSEVRELGRYQQLVEGHAASDDRLLAQLIEQWIVSAEATAAHYPLPIEAEVNREIERLGRQFASPEAYRERLQQLGLPAAAVRRLMERQIYLGRYVDYKFRPAVQVDAGAIEKYYREQLVPPMAAKGQAAPALEIVQDEIRELLVQAEISRRSAQWLEDTRSRLRIEFHTPGDGQ
jgi:DNA repair exonuclease SbcCD ATPase subunit